MRKTEKMTNLKTNQKGISTRHNPSVSIKDATAGITLIALVITIIVLLILAGVAISMLSGENGILKQAAEAKTSSDEAKLSESIKLAAMTVMTNKEHKLTEEAFKAELEKDGYKVNEDGTVTDKNEKYALTNKGAVKATIEELKNVEAELYTKLKLKDVNDEEIVVPAGFKIKKDSPTTVKRGMVVVGPDGSEFVWIPVPDPSKMYGTDSAGNKLGKLYEFTKNETEITVSALNWEENEEDGVMSWKTTTGDTSKREPAYINGTANGDAVTGDSTKGIGLLKSIVQLTGTDSEILSKWQAQLQNEYKEMIESVETNKGFYVGRYETSLNTTTKYAQSISGVKSATAKADSANTWYGLYQKEKDYSINNGLTDKVGSSMIWGSQYDQMMIMMKNNGIDVTSTTPINLEGVTTSRNTSRVTGSKKEDKLNNIYDLLGNGYEWTLEAHGTANRIYRGGYNYSNTAIYREDYNPWTTYESVSSRLALYVK